MSIKHNSWITWIFVLVVAALLGTNLMWAAKTTLLSQLRATQRIEASAIDPSEALVQLDLELERQQTLDQLAHNSQAAKIQRQHTTQWANLEAQWINPAWAVFFASVPAVATILLWTVAIATIGGLFIAADIYRRRATPLVWADTSGSLPVARNQIGKLTSQALRLLEEHHKAQQMQALATIEVTAHQVPHNLTYSPHLVYHNRQPKTLVQSEEPAERKVPTPISQAPSFSELLSQGLVGPDTPLLLGFEVETGNPLVGEFDSIYSLLIGGLSGSGKTTSQRHLAAMLALKGCKFVVCDPHGDSGEESLAGTLAPLSCSYLCEVAVEDDEILAAVRLVSEIGERRIRGRDESRQPIMLWVDEITSLLQKDKVGRELGTLIEEIARQYRKVGVFCSASGQNWSAVRSGGNSALRESFASILCHRLRRTSARMLVPAGDAALVERLPTGRALLWRTTGEATVIAVPNCSLQDIEKVAQLLNTIASVAPQHGYQPANDWLLNRLPSSPSNWMPVSQAGSPSSPSVSQNKPEVAATPPSEISSEARRAAELFLSGASPAEVVMTIRGIKSNQGATYQRTLDEVLELIRIGVPGIVIERNAHPG